MATNQYDYSPTASLKILKLRANLLQRTRQFFGERGFLEVETPLLSSDTVVDRHLDPLKVVLYDDSRQPQQGPTYWLQTSPEFGMKRLVATHGQSLFQITRAFRAGERGRLHNPEFTMLEWYAVGASYQEGIRFLDELSTALLGRGSAEFISYREAFLRYANVDPLSASANELAELARAQGIPVSTTDLSDVDAWRELLLVECVEPHLGKNRPVILYDYPASQAALARVRDEDVPVAERFELYVDGVELANGYHELLDADVLLRRAQQNNELRVRDGKEPLPIESRLLAAMRHGMPPCTGVALGFDRLVMIAAGATSIDEVLSFPIERA